MLNHITLMGRLTRDPELRYTQSGTPVASFTLAVDRDFAAKDGGERQTDFIDCVAWRQTGEFVSKYFQKGSMAVVCGRLQIRDWQDKEGNKRRSAEVVTDNVYFGESKRSRDDGVTVPPPPEAAMKARLKAPAFLSLTMATVNCRSKQRIITFTLPRRRKVPWHSIRTQRTKIASAKRYASSALTSAITSTIRTLQSSAVSCPSAARFCPAVQQATALRISVSLQRQ